jgi:hypothetical protein
MPSGDPTPESIMALKQDADFLRFLTMGAAGSAAVLDALNRRHGHHAIELERYATANKLWATKIKRLRLADLVCLDCGIRVEVRAKSALAIRMSHSEASGREWDAGLRDRDLVAFIAWNRRKEIASETPQFFEIGAMRSTVDHAKLGPRKSASEGAERDLTWPARVPKRDGEVLLVDRDNGTITYSPTGGRRHTYRLPAGVPVQFYAEEGQALKGQEEFIVGCVASPDDVACQGRTWDWQAGLRAGAATDRYAAVKAAGLAEAATSSERRLLEIAHDPDEDKRIALEARGSLARIHPDRYVDDLARTAEQSMNGSTMEMALGMESIFILSELDCPPAANALAALAANAYAHSEARSAAVWGLGTAGLDQPGRILPFIADPDDTVALHALAAIGDVVGEEIETLGTMLIGGDDREAASAVTLLAEDGDAGVRLLLEVAKHDDRAALWARAALGKISKEELLEASGGTLSSKLETLLSPMWLNHGSWLGQQGLESPLDFLRRQRIRHLPHSEAD